MSNQLRLLFFMVVISGALCTVEDYVIMSQCAHNKAINLAAEGTVSVTDISKTQNITIVGLPDYINNDFKITLYAKETQRYLCFNENWKLVGMRELQETCYFNETIVHGYFVFRSVVDLQRRVGFTHRGKAIGPKKNVTDACYLFTKIHAEQFFHQHTQFYTPRTKTSSSSSSSFSSSSTKATTAAASSTPAVTSTTTTASKSKTSRHRSNNKNNNHNNNSNGMRNSNNSNQNQQHTLSHTSNISNSNSNSNTNLSSTTPQHLNVSNTREQRQQQHHQVRHHHNDPNVVARRHQHEHKQKQKQRRQRNRTRATTSPNPTIMTRSKTIITTTTTTTTTTTQINKHATSATQTASSNKAATTSATTTQVTAANMLSAKMRTTAATLTTTVANKRKGRRRKGEKVHKQPQQRMLHQHLPANAKDQQHREAHKASHATRLANRHQGATRRQEDVDDAAQGTASSSADYSSQSTESSSAAPSSSSTASEALQDYDDSSSASSSTLLLSSSPSSWTPQQSSSSSSSNADSDAYSVSIATNLVSSMVPATVDSSVSATNTNAEVAATSTIDRETSSSTATQTSENELSSDSSSIASKPTTTTTMYNISNSWAAATLYDDLATTPTEAEPTPRLAVEGRGDNKLLLTPSAADISNTTTTTEAEAARSSSSDSFEATEEFLDTEATAETATTDAGGSNVAKESGSTVQWFSDDEKNTIDSNKNRGQRTGSPTATYIDAAPTLATLIGGNKMRTTQTAPTKLLAKQQPPKTTHLRRVGATRASMSSGRGSTSNNLDYSMTDYVLSTKSSNTHNKNHRHRQQNNNNSKALRNLNQQSNKSKSAFNSKQHHSKLHSKVGSPVTAIKAAATYLPATVGTSFTSSNPLDLLFGGSTRQQHVINEYDSLKNVHKNINHNQHNNTLLDYTSSSSSGTGNYSPQVPEFVATPTTATRKALRKSTQKLLATPFHQLTYVRNDAGDIDIDNIDNISVYSDLMDVDVSGSSSNNNGSDSALSSSSNSASGNNGNSRMTIVSGYLPTSATATLPESIRIAKIKINKVRKRTLRQRYTGGHA